MRQREEGWTLLVYKLPPQPTRMRIQVWRKLQALGAVYLQDGVAALPSREDLDENLSYIATSIEELGGSSMLLRSAGRRSKDGLELISRFRRAADTRMAEILKRLDAITLPEVHSIGELSAAEDGIKRERVAYLRARRLSYFGSESESIVEDRLAEIGLRLEEIARGTK